MTMKQRTSIGFRTVIDLTVESGTECLCRRRSANLFKMPMRDTSYRKRMLVMICLLMMQWVINVSAQAYIAGEDEAFYDAYKDGWQTGDWSGRGFRDWKLFAPEYASHAEEGQEQYAGFFIAEADKEADLGASAREGKAFGIFANGTGFEETVAFRAFEQPLGVGDVFSFRFEFDAFSDRFESQSEEISSVGIALRIESDANSLAELASGRAMVLAVIEGLSTYQILDADPRFNTRVFIDPAGIEVGITVREEFRYDLQMTTLSDQVAHYFPNRALKLMPTEADEAQAADPEIKSFALFNLNGGDSNAYFGSFQISAQE